MEIRNIKCIDLIKDFTLFTFLNDHNISLVSDKHEITKSISLGNSLSHYTPNNNIELKSSRVPSIEDIENIKSTYTDADLSPVATSDWVKKLDY